MVIIIYWRPEKKLTGSVFPLGSSSDWLRVIEVFTAGYMLEGRRNNENNKEVHSIAQPQHNKNTHRIGRGRATMPAWTLILMSEAHHTRKSGKIAGEEKERQKRHADKTELKKGATRDQGTISKTRYCTRYIIIGRLRIFTAAAGGSTRPTRNGRLCYFFCLRSTATTYLWIPRVGHVCG